ncbi:MAG: thermonuclease family protein [Patescibacteria group bacterium]
MKRQNLYIIGGIVALLVIIGVLGPKPDKHATQDLDTPYVAESVKVNTTQTDSKLPSDISDSFASTKLYSVVSVVDGDTIKVIMDGKTETFRLIGMDTPETVDPRKPVQCFGVESSNKAKELLSGKKVRIETDASQGTYDKYNRLLGYVFREDGLFYNEYMIEQGYAHEYTYNTPYKYQADFKNAQKEAEANKVGLWSLSTCSGDTTKASIAADTATNSPNSCTIKGNISSSGKIYHMIGCGSYNKTVIDESKGEKWFCSEKEAIDAGWRKALNCN